MKHLAGIIPVVVMPFEADGSIDHGSLERLVEDYCACGIAGMIVPAMASEVNKLSGPEGKLGTPRCSADVLLYNEAAREVMEKYGVTVNDL